MNTSDYLYPFSNCGCPKTTKTQNDEVERVLREIEEEDSPTRTTDPHGIPVEDWPVRKSVEVGA